ncbi:hypothetical protein ACEN2J_08635 [Pseudorhodobacter sp. W20_MBD10_FR17]|uniref:hypothetical protein n=1 Tax=Pseudorhodobacter sp. W20_MBD10_FR17 TaxID=3240266 RepID=UPI003F96BE0D
MHSRVKRRVILAGLACALAGIGLSRWMSPKRMAAGPFAARYATPLRPPDHGLSVYHLGHSLVGRDMPVMLDQLAQAAGFATHHHASQLGWGASLDQHRTGAVPGFAEENAHSFHQPAQSLAKAGYDAVIFAEMVEIRDAIRYHDSGANLAHWARVARSGNPDVRLYLYELWHNLDDPEGWLDRIDRDLTQAWQDELLRVAMADPAVGTIYLIPGGQVLAAATRAIEAGKVPGLTRREDLFAKTQNGPVEDGAVDQIHLNDLGTYIIALTHFAVLYQRSPEGLPHSLRLANGQLAIALPPAAVVPLQRLVWQAVSGYAFTGVAG